MENFAILVFTSAMYIGVIVIILTVALAFCVTFYVVSQVVDITIYLIKENHNKRKVKNHVK